MTRVILIFSALLALCSASSIQQSGLFQPKDFSTVLSSCKAVQQNIIYFTNVCYLFYDDVSKNLDTVKAYVLKQNDDLKVDVLLKNGFEGSTEYFQTQYPVYNTQYKDFENRIVAIMNKIKVSTSNAMMTDFKSAILDSKMDEVYNAIVKDTSRICSLDSIVCEKTNEMFGLKESTLATLNVHQFLAELFDNIFKYFSKTYTNNDDMEADKKIVNAMLTELQTKGTSGTMSKLVKDFFASKLFVFIRNVYDRKISTALPIKTRTTASTTTKTTVTRAPKTTAPQYITMAVYLSVPLAILFLGIVATVLVIILYYRMRPQVGGQPMAPTSDQTKTSKF